MNSIIATIISLLLSLTSSPTSPQATLGTAATFSYATTTISVEDRSYVVQIADTPKKRQLGLSGRPSLGEGEGMLFVFPEAGLHRFWMKDMNFPIDIYWLGKNYEVVDVAKNVPPESYPKTFSPKSPANYVLETNPN